MSEKLAHKQAGIKIPLDKTFHFVREGFSGDVYVEKTDDLGFNALLVTVDGKHPKKRMVGATRNYFVIEGEGTFALNGVEHTVQKGDLFIIPEGSEYEYEGKMKLFEFNVPGTDSSNSELVE